MKTTWITKTLAMLTVLALAFCALAAAPAAALAAGTEPEELPAFEGTDPGNAEANPTVVTPAPAAATTPPAEAPASETAAPAENTAAPAQTNAGTTTGTGTVTQYASISDLTLYESGATGAGTAMTVGNTRTLVFNHEVTTERYPGSTVSWSTSAPGCLTVSGNRTGATITATKAINADIYVYAVISATNETPVTLTYTITGGIITRLSDMAFNPAQTVVFTGTKEINVGQYLNRGGYTSGNVTYSIAPDDGSAGTIRTTTAGACFYTPPASIAGTGNVTATITATVAPSATLGGSSANFVITVSPNTGGVIYFNPAVTNLQEGAGYVNLAKLLKGSHPALSQATFDDAGGFAGIKGAFWSNGLALLPAKNTNAAASTITVTATVPASGQYGAQTATLTVKVYPANSASNLSLSVSTIYLSVSSLNAFDQSTFTVASTGTAEIQAEIIEGAAHVNIVDGTTIMKPGYTNTQEKTFTVTGLSTGVAKIRFYADDVYTDKYVSVVVGNPAPTVKAWYSPSTSLNKKSSTYTVLYVHVDNAPVGAEVSVYRSNIRTYLRDYSTHPSTYAYTVTLNAAGDAYACVMPQYNGTTYYTVTYNGVSANAGTITVSGFTTLPQTGPNYTWAYILGGLCLAAAATAVTLNVRKKKKSGN